MLQCMTSSSGRCLSGLLLLCAAVTARGDLVLTNYTGTNLLKVMAIGDSITDDCSINGAWRAPLQPLLETNEFPFTFVGRQSSSTSTGFSKVRHEGYCGAVVAPPGVFPAHQYSDVNNYLQKIVPDALAIASNQPDVVLILIGANDIGRGRNPFQVATNDMAALLAIVFSNAPNANVILAKASSLQNGSAGGLIYGTYAPNVPTYNAALQKVVNQRRALGQNVFLADLYSAVDFNTMFLSDHVHPNALGLQAMAKEWLTRLQAITTRTNLVTSILINGGASWKYNDTGQDLGTNWTQTAYDDSGWSNGIARLGYGDQATATTVSYGPQANNKFVTTCFRRSFVVPGNAVITNLNLRVARADGVVVWLNGQEIYRTNLPAGPITSTNLALTAMTVYNRHIFYPTNVPVNLPAAGTNWIAAEVHLSSVTTSAMGFDLELIGSGYLLPPPSLAIARADSDNVTLNWPLSYGSSFSLYSTTNLNATDSWTLAAAAPPTNTGQITITQSLDSSAKFFRLQQP
jgi:GDSL-like Lipase/Acylhydrolase family